MIVTIPKTAMLRGSLDEERDELLLGLAELDGQMQERPFLRKLILARLAASEAEYQRLGLPTGDPAEFAEHKDYLARLNRGEEE